MQGEKDLLEYKVGDVMVSDLSNTTEKYGLAQVKISKINHIFLLCTISNLSLIHLLTYSLPHLLALIHKDFSSKCGDFSELCQFCCSVGV